MDVDKALEIAKYYEGKYLETLDRLHCCKRDHRINRDKLRRILAIYEDILDDDPRD